MKHVVVALSSVLLVIAGCSGKSASGSKSSSSECSVNSDCANGEACFGGACLTLCSDSTQCSTGFACEAGACVPTTQSVPILTSVDGTGSADGDATHASRHLNDRLVVNGQHFLDASFTLTGISPPRDAIALAPCSPGTDTSVELALPTDIGAGTYLLSVANQAGACDATLQLLQGEPGTLDASGTQIIASINAVTAADPTNHVTGALVGAVSTISAMTSTTSPASRSILVDGVEQVDETTGGLFLVVFNLADHSIYDVVAASVLTTRQNYDISDPLVRSGMQDVLATLTDDQIVIIASTGDVTAAAQDAALAAALKTFGASPLFENLTADDSYLFIGQRNIGEGNGLESVGHLDRAGVAALGTSVIDQSVIGIGTKRALSSTALQPGSVTSGSIADGTIALADLGANACTANQIIKRNGANNAWVCAADANTTYTAGAGLALAGTAFSHADTSTLASVNNANGTVIQDVTVDTYGHVTALVSADLDGRYFTETESDGRFVNVTGDTMSGNLTVNATVNGNVVHTNGLGNGQTFIEGSYIDGNGVIRIGSGFAGGQAAQDVALGDNSEVYVDTSANRVGVGITTPATELHVAGTVTERGVKKIGDAASTTFDFTTKRYIVEAPPSMVGRVIPLDVATVNALCRDDDGCKVTIQMINYNSTGEPGNVASRGEYLFLSQSSTWWRFTNNDVQGVDANGGLNEWGVWDCYFTDAENRTNTTNGRADTAAGFGFLNVYGGTYSDTTTTCRIVFED